MYSANEALIVNHDFSLIEIRKDGQNFYQGVAEKPEMDVAHGCQHNILS